MKYTAQQFEKAGSEGSVEELLAMAKAENVELTAAEAVSPRCPRISASPMARGCTLTMASASIAHQTAILLPAKISC